MGEENDSIILKSLDIVGQAIQPDEEFLPDTVSLFIEVLENLTPEAIMEDLSGFIINEEENRRKYEISPETSLAVLDYMTQAYSAHGYYETGYWGKPLKNRNRNYRLTYPVYKGEVPKSNISDFYMPVIGAVTSGYGYRPHFHRIHHGVDINLNMGDTIRAALPGVVVMVGYEAGGYGNYVVLAHSDGVETRYGHLTGSLVPIGATVGAGEPIALGGNTGNSTGPHLHFETRIQGVPVDPKSFFGF